MSEESQKLSETLGRLRSAVDENFTSTDSAGHTISLGSGNWASLAECPALLAAQTRRKLKDESDVLSDDRKAHLKSQLHAAERAVAASEKELTRLEKESETIRKKQEKLNADKMLPESFQVIRSKTSHDDQIRKRAFEMGFHTVSGVTVTTEK